MKTAVMAPAMCDCRSDARAGMNEHEQRPEHNGQGQQQRPADTARRLLPSRSMRASVAICFSPQQHGDSHGKVIEGDKRHRHPRHGDDGLVARDAAHAHKGHKPDRGSNKENSKKEQCCSHAAQLGCPDAGSHKRRAETQAGQQTQRRRSGHAAILAFADLHQFRTRARLSTNASGRVCVPKQHAGQQHIDTAHQGHARARQQRCQRANFPGHGGKQQISQQARSQESGEKAGIRPQSRTAR